MIQRAGRLPRIGLAREREALERALDRRESLLLLGPAGCGKTTLLKSLLRPQPRADVLAYIPRFDTPHSLLLSLARELFRSGHEPFRTLAAAGADWETWLKRQTSSHLRGLLWESIERKPGMILLDHLSKPGRQTYRFLQRLCFTPGMGIVGAARERQDVGELRGLFWDPRQTVRVQPLSKEESLQLFEAAAAHYGLNGLALEEFRHKVLECAAGNPGQIVAMCRLASDPRYQAGTYIKFSLIRIEAKMAQFG